MNALSLDKVLADLNAAAGAEKTAAEAAPVAAAKETEKVAKARTDLLDALKRAETAASTKVAAAAAPAAATAPAEELQKMAADLAAADQEALVKEAQFYGAAIADGFMSRLQQYERAADSLPAEKTAGAADVEKIASDAVRGYIETQAAIKLAAEQEYARGYQDTVRELEKIASDTFGQGAADCAAALEIAAR